MIGHFLFVPHKLPPLKFGGWKKNFHCIRPCLFLLIFRHLPFQENKVTQSPRNCKREKQKYSFEIAVFVFIFNIVNIVKIFNETPGIRRRNETDEFICHFDSGDRINGIYDKLGGKRH
jgi:hypothetical protein